MADWDVVSSTPAQAADPWAVKGEVKVDAKAAGHFDSTVQRLKNVGGEAAAIADLVLGTPNFLVRTGVQLGGAVRAAGQGDADPLARGREAGRGYDEMMSEVPVLRTAASPLRSFLESLRSGEVYDKSLTTQGMTWVTEKIEAAGEELEKVTGGRVSRDALPLFTEVLMTSLSGIGTGITAKGRAKVRADDPKQGGMEPWQRKALRDSAEKMKVDAEAKFAEQRQAAMDRVQAAPDVGVQQQINDMLGIRTPAEQARVTRQRRKEVQQTFAREPAEGSDYVDTAESQFKAEERLTNERNYGQARAREDSIGAQQTLLDAAPVERIENSRIGQAPILEILQKAPEERTAADLKTVRDAQGWREIGPDEILQPGHEIKMDMKTGKSYVKEKGSATPEALALLGAAGLGTVAGGLIDEEKLRGAMLGGATGLAAVLPFIGRGASVPSLRGQAGAVKGPGGMWHPEAVERLSQPLKDNLANLGRDHMEAYYQRLEGIHPEWFDEGGGIKNGAVQQADKAAYELLAKDQPVVGWADKAVKNYLNRYAGTEKDPLKDVEIPVGEGTAAWGTVFDSAIKEHKARDLPGTFPNLEKMSPDETVYGLGGPFGADRYRPRELQSYLSHVGDYLRQNVDPAKLQQYDLVRAVRETAENDKRVAKEMEKAAAASSKDLPVYKEYPNGMKWVELKEPKELTPEQAKTVRKATKRELGETGSDVMNGDFGGEGLSKGYVAVDTAGKPIRNSYTQALAVADTPTKAYLAGKLAEEGNQMGHCVGGYCEGVASGESKIYSLRDKKGLSHVTVETIPVGRAKPRTWEGFKEGVIGGKEDILQIKGKQNRAPNKEYLPYVQDFVKSGKWGEVGDLEHSGLVDWKEQRGKPPAGPAAEVRAWTNNYIEEKTGGARFLPREEYTRLEAEAYKAFLQRNRFKDTPPLGWKAGDPDYGGNLPPRERGSIDQQLVMGLGAVGLGSFIGSQWADDPIRGAVLGAIAGGVLGSPAFARGIKKTGEGADYAAGMVSTRILQKSPALHQRLITHAQQELEGLHKALDRGVPWMQEYRKIPEASRDKIVQGIFLKKPELIAEANKGNPALVAGWREVRNTLADLGKKAQGLGRFKELLDDYFPQRVKDFEGLKQYLGQTIETRLEKDLKAAEARAVKRGTNLTDAERDAVINRVLRQQFQPLLNNPDYAQTRKINQVTRELQQFYHTPPEALAITIGEITRDLEMAKLFGRDLVQRKQEGRTYTDVGASIGNVLGEELKAGKITQADFKELQSMLLARFGPGERSPSRWVHNAQNLTYASLLADLPSAIVQLGDPAMSVPAHGLRSTLVAAGRLALGKATVTAKDLRLVDHIAEDLAFGSTQLGSSAATTKKLTLAGAGVGAVAGGLLGGDVLDMIPGMAAGAFLGHAKAVGTSAALNKVLKYGVFSTIDRVGKNVQLGAAHHKLTQWAQDGAAGLRRFEQSSLKYKEAFGDEFPALVADLKAGRVTPRVRSALFAELSRTQPISKLESSEFLLNNPNWRLLGTLKRFMLKQADFIRRDAVAEIASGEEIRIAKGFGKLAEFVGVLGLSGATAGLLQNWLLGRPAKLDATDVMENVLKTFGLSSYVRDKMAQGGRGPVEAIIGSQLPPYAIMDRIIMADPKAVQYIPVIGQLYYNWELGGREEAELRDAAKAKKQGRDVSLSGRAEAYKDRKREAARDKREREGR